MRIYRIANELEPRNNLEFDKSDKIVLSTEHYKSLQWHGKREKEKALQEISLYPTKERVLKEYIELETRRKNIKYTYFKEEVSKKLQNFLGMTKNGSTESFLALYAVYYFLVQKQERFSTDEKLNELLSLLKGVFEDYQNFDERQDAILRIDENLLLNIKDSFDQDSEDYKRLSEEIRNLQIRYKWDTLRMFDYQRQRESKTYEEMLEEKPDIFCTIDLVNTLIEKGLVSVSDYTETNEDALSKDFMGIDTAIDILKDVLRKNFVDYSEEFYVVKEEEEEEYDQYVDKKYIMELNDILFLVITDATGYSNETITPQFSVSELEAAFGVFMPHNGLNRLIIVLNSYFRDNDMNLIIESATNQDTNQDTSKDIEDPSFVSEEDLEIQHFRKKYMTEMKLSEEEMQQLEEEGYFEADGEHASSSWYPEDAEAWDPDLLEAYISWFSSNPYKARLSGHRSAFFNSWYKSWQRGDHEEQGEKYDYERYHDYERYQRPNSGNTYNSKNERDRAKNDTGWMAIDSLLSFAKSHGIKIEDFFDKNDMSESLKKIYRVLAKHFHPDKNQGKRQWSETQFKFLQNLWSNVKKENQRYFT